MKNYKLSAVIGLLLLTACVAPETQRSLNGDIRSLQKTSLEEVVIYHDRAHGVTCWLYDAYAGAGISCLPDSELVE